MGTEGEGNMFPGSTRPYGAVRMGPDLYTGSDAYSGYLEAGVIEGFSMMVGKLLTSSDYTNSENSTLQVPAALQSMASSVSYPSSAPSKILWAMYRRFALDLTKPRWDTTGRSSTAVSSSKWPPLTTRESIAIRILIERT